MATVLEYTDRKGADHELRLGIIDSAKVVRYARHCPAFSPVETADAVAVTQLMARGATVITLHQIRGTVEAFEVKDGLPAPVLRLHEFLTAAMRERKPILVH